MVCRRCGFNFADDLSICPSCRTPAAEPPAWLFVSDPSTPPPPPPAPVVESASAELPAAPPDPSPVGADDDPGYFGRRSTAWAEAFPETAPPPQHLSSNPWVSFDDDADEKLGSLFTEEPPQPTAEPPRPSAPSQATVTPSGPDGSASLDPLPPVSLVPEAHADSSPARFNDEALFLSSDLPDLSSYQEQLEQSLTRPPSPAPVSPPPPLAAAPVEKPSPMTLPAPPPPVPVETSPAQVEDSPAPVLSPAESVPTPTLDPPSDPDSTSDPVAPPTATHNWSPLPETKVPQALFMGGRLPSTPSAETSLRAPTPPTPIVAPPTLGDGVIVGEDQGREKRRSRVVENRALLAVLFLSVLLVAAIALAIVFILSA